MSKAAVDDEILKIGIDKINGVLETAVGVFVVIEHIQPARSLAHGHEHGIDPLPFHADVVARDTDVAFEPAHVHSLRREIERSCGKYDRSAARGMMATRKLIVFKHATALGNAHANKLFERVQIAKKDGVAVPRSFADYEVSIDRDGLNGVELIEMP